MDMPSDSSALFVARCSTTLSFSASAISCVWFGRTPPITTRTVLTWLWAATRPSRAPSNRPVLGASLPCRGPPDFIIAMPGLPDQRDLFFATTGQGDIGATVRFVGFVVPLIGSEAIPVRKPRERERFALDGRVSHQKLPQLPEQTRPRFRIRRAR